MPGGPRGGGGGCGPGLAMAAQVPAQQRLGREDRHVGGPGHVPRALLLTNAEEGTETAGPSFHPQSASACAAGPRGPVQYPLHMNGYATWTVSKSSLHGMHGIPSKPEA